MRAHDCQQAALHPDRPSRCIRDPITAFGRLDHTILGFQRIEPRPVLVGWGDHFPRPGIRQCKLTAHRLGRERLVRARIDAFCAFCDQPTVAGRLRRQTLHVHAHLEKAFSFAEHRR